MASSLRVLYVIDSLAAGGAETSLAAIARPLLDQGVELHVAYFTERTGVHRQLLDSGATIQHIDAARVARVVAIRRLIRQRRPALVHTTLYEADQVGRIAARLTGVPVISSLVSVGFDLGELATVQGLKSRAALGVDVATAQLVNRFHAVSDPVASVMSQRLHVPIDRMTVIPRGRDPQLLGTRSTSRRDRTREALDIASDRKVVLAVGRQVAAKNLTTLVDALPSLLRRHPDVVVVLAGRPGPETDAIEQRIAGAGVGAYVRLLGHRDDVADLLTAADALAFPSRREGFPGTLVEALALECPIVASDITSVRSVVDDGSASLATLVPVDDPVGLAEALGDVLDDRPVARTEAGRRWFEASFTTMSVGRRMADLYRATAAG